MTLYGGATTLMIFMGAPLEFWEGGDKGAPFHSRIRLRGGEGEEEGCVLSALGQFNALGGGGGGDGLPAPPPPPPQGRP